MIRRKFIHYGLKQGKNYIEKYFHEKLALKKIAFKMHGSPYHLSRVFKESIHTYQTKIRLETAKKLLKTTDDFIESIGKQVGIINSSQFIAQFKKEFQVTPQKYRKENIDELY